MPRPKSTEQAETQEVLQPFNVIIDGQDRVIFAKDQADLDARIAKIRGQ